MLGKQVPTSIPKITLMLTCTISMMHTPRLTEITIKYTNIGREIKELNNFWFLKQ